MDELKQIILHKLKLIQSYHSRSLNLVSAQQKTALIQILLKQKRKQNSRDVIQSRLLQILSTHRIQAPYRIQEFYKNSLNMMQIYSPDFEYKHHKDDDQIGDIVNMYANFFQAHECSRRAQEIKHIYHKKLCERGIIIPTVFNWFVQWLRKIFKQFIRKTLNQLNDKTNSNLILIQQNKKLYDKIFMQQITKQKQSLSLINSQIKIHKQKQLSLQIHKSKLLSPNLVIKTSRSSIKHQLQNLTNSSIQKLKPASIHQYCEKLIHISSSPTKQLADINNKDKQRQGINLNKDIFYSSYFEQIGCYYKFYSFLEDIDENYSRNFRKVDRREQINKNINVLVKSMARNQPNDIKNSIQTYSEAYIAKFGRIQMKQEEIIKKKMKKYLKRVSQSVNIHKQINQQQVAPKCDLSLDHNAKPHRTKQSFPLPRTQAIKKKIQLQLPDIKSKSINYKSIQKIILVHGNSEVVPKRYQKHKQDVKNKLSAELEKQLRQINSLFKKRNGLNKESITFIGKTSFQADGILKNPIRFQKNQDQISELLDGQFDADGIFRLPKIFR